DLLGEVGAVVGSEMKMRAVGRRVQLADQCIVLLGRGFDFEAVDRAVVGRADQLVPDSAGSFAVDCVGGDVFEIFPSVLVAQKSDHFCVGEKRNTLGALDCVEVRDQGDGEPIVAVNAIVAAEDDAGFSRRAAAQNDRRIGANGGQIDGGVAGGGKITHLAVGFLKKQRG